MTEMSTPYHPRSLIRTTRRFFFKDILPNDYSSLNKVELVKGGRTYFDKLIQLIRESTETIHLQTYIYDGDETGQEVTRALIEAAKRNVQVYVLADGYASSDLSSDLINDMKTAGIHFRFFEPLFRARYYYFGRRMHHKVFVSDSRIALVGGMNIANRYNDFPGSRAWLDIAICVHGHAAQQLFDICCSGWNNFPNNPNKNPCLKQELQFYINESQKTDVRIRCNDWVRHKNEISGSYIEMFRHARSHITIMCSYFLPGRIIRRSLMYAVKRGVKIKVITAGPSDVLLAKRAERWMYDWLLRNNIELYEYQPTVLHAKVAVCDNSWFTIGSYNMNNISTYASVELNVDVKNASLATDFNNELETIMKKDCLAITKEFHSHSRNLFIQFKRWLSYQCYRILFFLLTFYVKQKRLFNG